jgi:hypothetical protein
MNVNYFLQGRNSISNRCGIFRHKDVVFWKTSSKKPQQNSYRYVPFVRIFRQDQNYFFGVSYTVYPPISHWQAANGRRLDIPTRTKCAIFQQLNFHTIWGHCSVWRSRTPDGVRCSHFSSDFASKMIQYTLKINFMFFTLCTLFIPSSWIIEAPPVQIMQHDVSKTRRLWGLKIPIPRHL